MDKTFFVGPLPKNLNKTPPPYIHNVSRESRNPLTTWPGKTESWGWGMTGSTHIVIKQVANVLQGNMKRDLVMMR